MKKANLLSRAEMKLVLGGTIDQEEIGDSGEGRCSSGNWCSFEGTGGSYQSGSCSTMQTGQCRCVSYSGGHASQSVPSNACLS